MFLVKRRVAEIEKSNVIYELVDDRNSVIYRTVQ